MPLEKKDLQAILDTLPEDATFWVRAGDNAYPAQVRAFMENGKIVVYFQHPTAYEITKCGQHRNFPERYGVPEIKLPDVQ